jgi:hypothetical protein
MAAASNRGCCSLHFAPTWSLFVITWIGYLISNCLLPQERCARAILPFKLEILSSLYFVYHLLRARRRNGLKCCPLSSHGLNRGGIGLTISLEAARNLDDVLGNDTSSLLTPPLLRPGTRCSLEGNHRALPHQVAFLDRPYASRKGLQIEGVNIDHGCR